MKRFMRHSGRRGFTMIEFIVYFFILGIVMTAVTSFTLDIMETRARVRLAAEVEQNMRLSTQRIMRAIRTAKRLNVGSSTFGDANGVLSLEMEGASVNPTVFDLASGTLRMTEGVGASVPLTTTDVVVEKFWVERDNLPHGTKAVSIQLKVKSLNPAGGKPFEYVSSTSSTAVLRRQR